MNRIDFDWLCKVGGAAALIAAAIFRRNLGAEFSLVGAHTMPSTVRGWFSLLQDNGLVGLAYLDLFDVVNYSLMGVMFLALYTVLKQTNAEAMWVALWLGFTGTAVRFASNQAFSMLSLSDRYVAAATEAEKARYLVAGEALLAMDDAQGMDTSLLLVTLAGLIVSVVMLQSDVFGKATAYAGILAHVLVLGHYVALALAPALLFVPHSTAAVPMLVWELLIARKLFRLAQGSATRITASIIGIYAGFLGVVHGYFEFLQGDAAPGGIVIHAIGVPCQPEAVAHACLPAMTLISNFQASGLLAIFFSMAALVWAAAFIGRRHGGLVLALLSVMMLLTGGGFLPPLYGIIAGIQMGVPLAWWQTRVSGKVLRFLAGIWLWTLAVYLAWVGIQMFFGDFLNDFLLGAGGVLLPLEIGVLLLSIASAFAYDIAKTH